MLKPYPFGGPKMAKASNQIKKQIKNQTKVKKEDQKKDQKLVQPKIKKPAKTGPLDLGAEVPLFSAKTSNGSTFDLLSSRGKKLVLYFYPKDDTPGCTLEGQQFNELNASFKKQNTLIFGISRDSVKSHDKFKCKYGFNFDLLSDEDEKICKIFGVIKEKNMYGKKVFGIERSTFIIDEKGRLNAEYRGVKADGHAAEILRKVKEI